MTYKDLTFNANRKIVNFKDFNPTEEKEELETIKRGFKKNDKEVGPSERKYKYNKVTHKLDDLSKMDVDDRLDSLDENLKENSDFTSEYSKPNNRIFSIFSVSDYKGGELKTNLNIGEEGLCEDLVSIFSKISINIASSTYEEVLQKLESIIKYPDDYFSLYAGRGGFTGKIYEHKDGLLVEVKIGDFVEFLPCVAKILKEIYFEL